MSEKGKETLKARIAVLFSGGGTNLQALIDAQARGELHSGVLALVVSNNPNAYALTRAADAGIEALTLTRRDCGSQEAFEEKLHEALRSRGIGLIILAGFMSILGKRFTDRWPERILNVHPSLIASLCGKGFYGLRVHQAALDALKGVSAYAAGEIVKGDEKVTL